MNIKVRKEQKERNKRKKRMNACNHSWTNEQWTDGKGKGKEKVEGKGKGKGKWKRKEVKEKNTRRAIGSRTSSLSVADVCGIPVFPKSIGQNITSYIF